MCMKIPFVTEDEMREFKCTVSAWKCVCFTSFTFFVNQTSQQLRQQTLHTSVHPGCLCELQVNIFNSYCRIELIFGIIDVVFRPFIFVTTSSFYNESFENYKKQILCIDCGSQANPTNAIHVPEIGITQSPPLSFLFIPLCMITSKEGALCQDQTS